jgi:hypothetical protein
VIAGVVAVNSVTNVADNRTQATVGAHAPAARTELPAAQAVNPTANIPAARNDAQKPDQSTPATSHDAIIDPQTKTIVFRSLDATTGAVIEQVPARALLRQRAYVDAQTVQALIKGKDVNAAALAAAQDVDTTA